MRGGTPGESRWVRVGQTEVLPLDQASTFSGLGSGPMLAVTGTRRRYGAAARLAQGWIDLPGEWETAKDAKIAVLRFARRFTNGARRELVDDELRRLER
jgi:hypothetical protein